MQKLKKGRNSAMINPTEKKKNMGHLFFMLILYILKETRNATKSNVDFYVFSRRFLKLLF